MTLCIALMCNQAANDAEQSMIVGVSDQLLTNLPNSPGERRFELSPAKFFSPSQATAVMIAGNTEMIATVLRKIQPVADAAIAEGDWVSVAALAEAYGVEYRAERARRLEHQILSRFSLTLNEYRSTHLDTAFRCDREREIAAYEANLGWDECLFAGLDDAGAHVYSCGSDGVVRCYDAATGSRAAGSKGAEYAQSYLETHGKTHLTPFADALHLAYSTKRRAKLRDRHVGKQTSAFVIGPGRGWGFLTLSGDNIRALDAIYDAKTSGETELRSVRALAATLLDPTLSRLRYVQGQGVQQSPASSTGDS